MPDPAPPSRPRFRASPVLIGTGALVIALGFGLPHLTPSTPALTQPPVAPEIAKSLPAPALVAPTGPAPAAPEFGMAVVRLLGGLVVVCALCVVAARYVNRRPAESAGPMQVLASLRVGPRCVVHLVRAGNRRLLIGTDPAGLKALLELPGTDPASFEVPDAAQAAEETPVVVGPVTVAVPAADPPGRDEVLALLAKIHAARVGPASPG